MNIPKEGIKIESLNQCKTVTPEILKISYNSNNKEY